MKELSYTSVVYKANQNGIRIITATSDTDKARCGIHLIKPNMIGILDAIDQAMSKGFTEIYLHKLSSNRL